MKIWTWHTVDRHLLTNIEAYVSIQLQWKPSKFSGWSNQSLTRNNDFDVLKINFTTVFEKRHELCCPIRKAIIQYVVIWFVTSKTFCISRCPLINRRIITRILMFQDTVRRSWWITFTLTSTSGKRLLSRTSSPFRSTSLACDVTHLSTLHYFVWGQIEDTVEHTKL